MTVSLILIVLITFAISLLLTKVAKKVAIQFHIGDEPGPRKVHKVFIPYLGGVAILFAVAAGTAISVLLLPKVAGPVPKHYYVLGLSCVFIALVGIFDDLRGLRFSTKFYCQILAAILVVGGGLKFDTIYLPLMGTINLGIFSFIFTVFWIVFITNAMNLLDGLDGLAAGVATIIFTTFAIISLQSGRTLVALINVIFIAANLGFLRYNFHPASIFMGDTGSLFIGFSVSVISLEVGRVSDTQTLNCIIPLTVMAVPVLDTTISFFRRASKRMHPFMADKEHIHHRLMSIGFSHFNAVKVIYFFSAVTSIMGLSFVWLDVKSIITVLLVGIIFSTLLIRRLGYVEIKKNLIVVGNGEKNGNSKINGLLNCVNGNGGKEKKFIPFDTSQFVQSFLFFLSDSAFIIAGFLITYFLWVVPKFPFLEPLSSGHTVLWITWSIIYWTSLLGLNDLYHIEWDTSRIDEIFTVLKIVMFGIIVLIFLSFEIKFPFLVSRKIFILYGFLLVAGLSLGRLLLITFLKEKEILEFKKRPTLIIGASERAINVVKKIKSVPILKFNLQGFIDEHGNGNMGKNIQGLPVLGGYQDIPDIIKKRKIKEVIIALDDSDRDEIIDLIALFSHYNVSIKLLPYFYNLMSGFRTSHVYGVSLIRFFSSNMKTWEWLLKRFIDIAISFTVLIAFLPLWSIICAIILLDSPGPIFYKQKRVGKNKIEYEVIKFRSMVRNAEEVTGPKWAAKDDPRITRFGRFLRKTGLDEIPQFANVLLGDMSIVGPRPERQYFVNGLENSVQFYSRRLIVKPGITGWAQIKHKYDETIEDVRGKLRYDLYYIENMSVLLDLKIIVQTLLVGLRKKHPSVRN